MNSLVLKQYQDQNVSFDLSNQEIMINFTEMCKPFEKKPADFLRLPKTEVFLKELAKSLNLADMGLSHNSENQLVTTIRDNFSGHSQGTWIHRKVAIKAAAWLSAEFEVWMINQIDELLVMGKVELENGNTEVAPSALPKSAFEIFEGFHRIAHLIGLNTNQSALSANQATLKHSGFNLLQDMNATHFLAETQEALYTPTQLGKQLGGLKPQQVNQLLVELALQYKENKVWVLTETGKKYGCYLDTVKKRTVGTPILQIKWYETVQPLLKDALSNSNPTLSQKPFLIAGA